MDLLTRLYAFVCEQLRIASGAPGSQYNEGFIDALSSVKECAEEIAWEEGEQLDG